MASATNLKFDGKLEDGLLLFQPHYISYTILYRIIHYNISYTVPYFYHWGMFQPHYIIDFSFSHCLFDQAEIWDPTFVETTIILCTVLIVNI